MTITIGRLLALAALLVPAAFAAASDQAQNYPERPVQVIVPFAGGSASDVVTRVLLDRMGKELGQAIVIENRPGAGGNIGTALGARSEPDGYTLVMSTSGPLAANTTLYHELGYDPQKNLAPIGLFAMIPNIIVVSTKLPVHNIDEFIAYAKAHPNEVKYGSVGIGSSQHLAGAYFEEITGVQMVHVPYRNISQYVTDLIAGIVPAGFQFLPNVSGALASGDARALAVTSEKRLPALPDVPTIAETGIKGYESSGWLALLAPSGTPKPIIDKLHTALATAMTDANVRQRFFDLGAEPVATTPEQLGKFIASENVKWHDIIVKAGIPVGQL
jgi:tripartite-type tricarboxylate transporter receptor subunit TctC